VKLMVEGVKAVWDEPRLVLDPVVWGLGWEMMTLIVQTVCLFGGMGIAMKPKG